MSGSGSSRSPRDPGRDREPPSAVGKHDPQTTQNISERIVLGEEGASERSFGLRLSKRTFKLKIHLNVPRHSVSVT